MNWLTGRDIYKEIVRSRARILDRLCAYYFYAGGNDKLAERMGYFMGRCSINIDVSHDWKNNGKINRDTGRKDEIIDYYMPFIIGRGRDFSYEPLDMVWNNFVAHVASAMENRGEEWWDKWEMDKQ
jgi:hypothetical protein